MYDVVSSMLTYCIHGHVKHTVMASRFEHFWGVIRQFKDSIQQRTIGILFDLVFLWDSIWAMRFDS